jgi:hypothetical protein
VVATDTDGFDELAVPLDLLLTRPASRPGSASAAAGRRPHLARSAAPA